MAEDMNDAFGKRFEKLSEELADNSKDADRVAENVSCYQDGHPLFRFPCHFFSLAFSLFSFALYMYIKNGKVEIKHVKSKKKINKQLSE